MDIREIFGLENKNVVITGAGSGMGYAAMKLLYALGANVYERPDPVYRLWDSQSMGNE